MYLYMYVCTKSLRTYTSLHRNAWATYTYICKEELVYSLLQCYVWVTYVGRPCLQSTTMLCMSYLCREPLSLVLQQCYCMSYLCREDLSAVYHSATVWATYVERTCLQSTTVLLYELPTLEEFVFSLLQCYCMSHQCRKTLSAVYYSAMYELPMQEEHVCSLQQWYVRVT